MTKAEEIEQQIQIDCLQAECRRLGALDDMHRTEIRRLRDKVKDLSDFRDRLDRAEARLAAHTIEMLKAEQLLRLYADLRAAAKALSLEWKAKHIADSPLLCAAVRVMVANDMIGHYERELARGNPATVAAIEAQPTTGAGRGCE